MKIRTINAVLAFAALFCVSLLAEENAEKKQVPQRTTKEIASGVVYETISDPAGPWEIRLVKISRNAMKKYEFKISEANDTCPGLENTLDAFNRAKSRKENVIAAINGDSYYYQNAKKLGQPRALTVVDGRFFSIGDLRSRANLFIDADNNYNVDRGSMDGSTVKIGKKTYPLLALNDILVNGYDNVNGVFAYTADWGTLSTPEQGIEIKIDAKRLTIPGKFNGKIKGEFPAGQVKGDFSKVILVGFGNAAEINKAPKKSKVALNIKLTPVPAKAPLKLSLGGMGIIRKGETTYYSTDTARHPRTFWGEGPNCIVFGIVDGRRKGWSVGMNYEEMDTMLKPYNLTNIINLDGGGSTTLVIDGKIQNKPSDNAPRRTGNHLLLIKRK